MSKEPEVGDVWKFKDSDLTFRIIRIVQYGGFDTDIPETYQCLWLEKVFYRINNVQKDIFKDCEYLGHSKANIGDLFKTENEE